MDAHECSKPERVKWPPEPWTCPECGTVWRVAEPVEGYDFDTEQDVVVGRWERVV